MTVSFKPLYRNTLMLTVSWSYIKNTTLGFPAALTLPYIGSDPEFSKLCGSENESSEGLCQGMTVPRDTRRVIKASCPLHFTCDTQPLGCPRQASFPSLNTLRSLFLSVVLRERLRHHGRGLYIETMTWFPCVTAPPLSLLSQDVFFWSSFKDIHCLCFADTQCRFFVGIQCRFLPILNVAVFAGIQRRFFADTQCRCFVSTQCRCFFGYSVSFYEDIQCPFADIPFRCFEDIQSRCSEDAES